MNQYEAHRWAQAARRSKELIIVCRPNR